ncbi:MAG: hypothetical protein IKD08_02360 [Alphaproteobacteria bacterium]|nr:hypothetical protein [Alphaproteobacteria bacterium]
MTVPNNNLPNRPPPPKVRSDVVFLIVVLLGIFLVYGFFFLQDKGFFRFGEELPEADTSEGFIFRYDIDEEKHINSVAADTTAEAIKEEEVQKSYEIVGIWQIDAPNKFPVFRPIEDEPEEELPPEPETPPVEVASKEGGCKACANLRETPCGNYTLYYLEIEFDKRTKGDFLDVFAVNATPRYYESPKGKGMPMNAVSSYCWENARKLGGWPLIRLKSKQYRNVKITYDVGKSSTISYMSTKVTGTRILSRCEESGCRSTLQIFAEKTNIIPGNALKITDCRTKAEGNFMFSGCGRLQGPFCVAGQQDCPFTTNK